MLLGKQQTFEITFPIITSVKAEPAASNSIGRF